MNFIRSSCRWLIRTNQNFLFENYLKGCNIVLNSPIIKEAFSWKHINTGPSVRWFPWSELATPAIRIWNQHINILHSVHWSAWLWPFTQVIKWFLANPEKRKKLQLKNLRNNKRNRGVFHYIWAWWKGEIPSGSFRSTLPFLEKMAYIVYLQIVALRFQKNNIPDTGELLFSSGKNLPGSSPVQA